MTQLNLASEQLKADWQQATGYPEIVRDDFAAGSLLQGRVMQEAPKKPHPVGTRRQVTRRAIRDFIGLLVILATVGWLFWEWVQPGTWLR